MSVSLVIEEPICSFLEKIEEHAPPVPLKRHIYRPISEPEHAAKIIQRYVRAYFIKKKLNENPYEYYLACIDNHEQTAVLSMLMFGMRQSGFDTDSLEFQSNPFIDRRSIYHRTDIEHLGPLMRLLLAEFRIISDRFNYIPISHSANTPFADYFVTIKDKFPRLANPVQWITSDDHTISILALSKRIPYTETIRIREDISACGYVATWWEMAENIKNIDFISKLTLSNKIEMPFWLPTSYQAFLTSSIMGQLRMTAHSPNIGTQKLAQALLRLLKNTPDLSPRAIQRISLMLEITHLFYAHNYSKYAFCVYTIVHEISLSLTQVRSAAQLKKAYDEFLQESKDTFCDALDIGQTELNIFSAPSLSGTNAYNMAIKLAGQLLLDRPPSFKLVMNNYYELEKITSNSQLADDETDVFIFSAGPILNLGGLVPGIDINLFIEQHLRESRTNPATIIIDTTTTLYRNLRLNQRAKELIATGKLSIIIHESRQKFGLLHTDQAQYGRVFGVCSPLSYKKESLIAMEEGGFMDFMSHIDIRVGALLSVHCSNILEDIKHQHFKNGAVMRDLLSHAIEVSDIVEHPMMSGRFNELYFLSFNEDHAEILWNATDKMIESRASFGHYHTVKSRYDNHVRFSADASDDIDNLIKTTQIFLGFFYSLKRLVPTLIEYSIRMPDNITIAQQILVLAMLNNISNSMTERDFKPSSMVKLYLAMANILDKCQDLKTSSFATNMTRYLGIFRKTILEKMEISFRKHVFMNTIRAIFLIDPSLINHKMLFCLKNKVWHSQQKPFLLYEKKADASMYQPLSSVLKSDIWHLLVKLKLHSTSKDFVIKLDPNFYALLWSNLEKNDVEEIQNTPSRLLCSI